MTIHHMTPVYSSEITGQKLRNVVRNLGFSDFEQNSQPTLYVITSMIRQVITRPTLCREHRWLL